MKELNKISGRVVDLAYHIHRDLGPGLTESVYEVVLARGVARCGYKVERQKPIDLEYDGMRFRNVCRPDLIVQDQLVIEVKSVEKIHRAHQKQLHTYLRLLDMRLGLLLNFAAPLMKDGIRRVINGYGM